MPAATSKSELILKIVRLLEVHPSGLSISEIRNQLDFQINPKTLQRRLSSLVLSGRVNRRGRLKFTKYYSPDSRTIEQSEDKSNLELEEVFSEDGRKSMQFLAKPKHFRTKTTYRTGFIDNYKPNETFYVPAKVRQKLYSKGRRFDIEKAAGSYVRLISQRIMIDLSYFSSKLEGNTYSLLDTENLIEHGNEAEGKVFEETQMILNHKAAIVFLIDNAETIDINEITIRSLHSLLAKQLLANYYAWGNIRTKPVVIGESSYVPLEHPEKLKVAFQRILGLAREIIDPFEQSFFLLVHLPYLQAFEDVNKRTSRLASNIPLFKHNLCPLSFVGVERNHYRDALLAFYEENAIQPMLDLYVWAYSNSCKEYDVVKQSVSIWNAKNSQYQEHLNEVMRHVILEGLHGKAIQRLAKEYCAKNQLLDDKAFHVTLRKLLRETHEGNVIILNVTPEQFTRWMIDEP